MKIARVALLVGLILANDAASARFQSAQTGSDQTKPGSNTTKNDAKAAKKDQSNITPAAPAATSAATNSTASASSALASKPGAATKPTPPASTAGMVWVNTESGVYHKPGTRWYGKTKQGKYMTEADAKKAGYHAASKE